MGVSQQLHSFFIVNFFVQMNFWERNNNFEELEWEIRKHWRFSDKLYKETSRFKKAWKAHSLKGVKTRYIGCHLRRNDWNFAHPDTQSSIDDTDTALIKLAHDLSIDALFIATDASPDECEQLRKKFDQENIRIYRYQPSPVFDKVYMPG